MRLSLKSVGLFVAMAGFAGQTALAATSHSEFIEYPAFREANAEVEMIHDKGLVAEVVVNCGGGETGILVLSKIEKRVCGPDHFCTPSLKTAIRRLCR